MLTTGSSSMASSSLLFLATTTSHSVTVDLSPTRLHHARRPPPPRRAKNNNDLYNLSLYGGGGNIGLEKWRAKVSFFPAFSNKKKVAETIKEELLEAIAPLDRGAEATPQDQENIDLIARKLEAVSSIKEPLKSDLLNGKWELIYTTSPSILQTQRPKFLRSRANYQAINADILRAQNMEAGPFFNQVTADLTPLNSKKVAVKFDYFKIGGLIPVKAPDRARGSLEITYLDEELRISRGDKGNLFILKMVDPSYRIPT